MPAGILSVHQPLIWLSRLCMQVSKLFGQTPLKKRDADFELSIKLKIIKQTNPLADFIFY